MLTIKSRRMDTEVSAGGVRAERSSARAADEGRLVALAERIVRSRDLAQDAVQEAQWHQLQRQEEIATPDAWLRTSVVKRSLHLARSERRRSNHETEAARRSSCPACDPTAHLEWREFAEQLICGLEQLCPEHREVMRLKAREGLDYQAIASRLGVPVGTVRSRLNRARTALRRSLGPSFQDVVSPRRERAI